MSYLLKRLTNFS